MNIFQYVRPADDEVVISDVLPMGIDVFALVDCNGYEVGVTLWSNSGFMQTKVVIDGDTLVSGCDVALVTKWYERVKGGLELVVKAY